MHRYLHVDKGSSLSNRGQCENDRSRTRSLHAAKYLALAYQSARGGVRCRSLKSHQTQRVCLYMEGARGKIGTRHGSVTAENVWCKVDARPEGKRTYLGIWRLHVCL